MECPDDYDNKGRGLLYIIFLFLLWGKYKELPVNNFKPKVHIFENPTMMKTFPVVSVVYHSVRTSKMVEPTDTDMTRRPISSLQGCLSRITLRFLHKFIYVICVCLRIVVSNTYCVVFFFSSCVPYIASFSGLSIFDCPFGIL